MALPINNAVSTFFKPQGGVNGKAVTEKQQYAQTEVSIHMQAKAKNAKMLEKANSPAMDVQLTNLLATIPEDAELATLPEAKQEQPVSTEPQKETAPPPASAHTITKGDTLWSIARKSLSEQLGGRSVSNTEIANYVNKIVAENKDTIKNKDNIRIGTEITLPSVRPQPTEIMKPDDVTPEKVKADLLNSRVFNPSLKTSAADYLQ